MLVKVGPIVTAIGGSVAGLTIQRTRSGQLGRSKPLPILRRTASTNTGRSSQQYFSRTWSSISSTDRDAWNAQAAATTWYNRFGDRYTPTGFMLYMQSQQLCRVIGASAPSVPGAVVPLSSIVGLKVTSSPSSNQYIIDWDGGNVPAGESWLVQATPQLSPGVYNPRNAFRIIGLIPQGTGTGIDLASGWFAAFGPDTRTGRTCFTRVRPISNTWGDPGSWHQVRTTT